MTEQNKKVFGIGFHKTGTKSLSKAMKILGFRTYHGGTDKEDIGTKISENKHTAKLYGINNKLMDGILDRRDAFFDEKYIQYYFRLLDEDYPDGLFIFHTRDLESRLESKKRHAKKMGRTPRPNVWTRHYNLHTTLVKKYFEGKNNILFMDVSKGDGWDKLCPFLGLDKPLDDFPFIKDD